MCSTQSELDLLRSRDDVTGLLQAEDSLGEAQEPIELSDAARDQKAALWLLAFSRRAGREREGDAKSYLSAVADR
jgi:hypothetical protein